MCGVEKKSTNFGRETFCTRSIVFPFITELYSLLLLNYIPFFTESVKYLHVLQKVIVLLQPTSLGQLDSWT